jgi:hypothetical protein
MAGARSEGGGVEVNSSSVLQGRQSRGRWRQCDKDQELEEEDGGGMLRGQGRVGGVLRGQGRGGGMLWGRDPGWQVAVVSRAIAKRGRARVQKFVKCGERESAGLKF